MKTTVYRVAAKLRQDQDFDAAIAGIAATAPDAMDFVDRFKRASISRIATSRYLLSEIEIAKRKTQEMDVAGTGRVHVEHIYSQTPQEGQRWANHPAVVNRLGNHTLLSKGLNTKIKNADFATKKKDAYGHSDIFMTKELCAYDEWTTDTIADRQAELSTWIMSIWAFPGEDSEAEAPEAKTTGEAPATADATEAVPAPAATSAGGAAEEPLPEVDPDQLPEVPLG